MCFLALEEFRTDEKRLPKVWDLSDAKKFVEIGKSIAKENKISEEDLKDDSETVRLLYLFSFQCQGVFNPLCAFLGGMVAQECIKAITQKFSPAHQLFYYDAIEVLPDFNVEKSIKGTDDKDKDDKDQKQASDNYFEEIYKPKIVKTAEKGDRSDGLRIVVGQDIINKLANTNLFMVGAGAIGCELLKNFAMLGVGCGKKEEKSGIKGGSIVLTDPDVIEVSNLSR